MAGGGGEHQTVKVDYITTNNTCEEVLLINAFFPKRYFGEKMKKCP